MIHLNYTIWYSGHVLLEYKRKFGIFSEKKIFFYFEIINIEKNYFVISGTKWAFFLYSSKKMVISFFITLASLHGSMNLSNKSKKRSFMSLLWFSEWAMSIKDRLKSLNNSSNIIKQRQSFVKLLFKTLAIPCRTNLRTKIRNKIYFVN